MSWVTHDGPIFDGRAAAATRDFCEDWERQFADKAVNVVRTTGQGMFKHSTGNWSRHIHAVARGGDQEVNDSNIIYGPWLEGTGSRNAPKTRFRGYSIFRKATQRLQREAAPNAEGMLHQGYLQRMQ